LFNADKQFYLSLSEKTGFHKDVIEKVHRLVTILEFINTNVFLRERLVLKGGTAGKPDEGKLHVRFDEEGQVVPALYSITWMQNSACKQVAWSPSES
jgi:hypothetical protein